MLEVIRFTSPTCVPCRTLGPKLDELADKYPEVKFERVDVTENFEKAAEFGVMGVPRVFFVKDGQIVDEFSGDKPKETIELAILLHM